MNTPYAVDRKRWSKLTTFEMMGNIYSEVGRSFNAKRRNDTVGCEQAMSRAIDLFDATTSLFIAMRSAKAKEVLRAKEEYLDLLYTKNIDPKRLESLDRYFMQFAIASRLAH